MTSGLQRGILEGEEAVHRAVGDNQTGGCFDHFAYEVSHKGRIVYNKYGNRILHTHLLHMLSVEAGPIGFQKFELGIHAEQGFRMPDKKKGSG